MVKRAGIAVLLFIASLICGSNAVYNKYCPTTPKTLKDDYITHCAKRMPNKPKGFCKDYAWSTFSASFASKDPEKVTARLVEMHTT